MTNWDFGQLPFIYAPQKEPTNGVLPDLLPFSLEFNPVTGLIGQVRNGKVIDALGKAYVESSMISGMMDDRGIGKRYADDFLAYIIRQSGKNDFSGCRILDIGCGVGYLLYLLQEQGAEVVGLEPGSHGQEGSKRFDVSIVRDFFPSDNVTGQFDIIVAFGLLEHVLDYDIFFRHILRQLASNGLLILAVPDCEPYIHSGDISFLFHEHWSYFTSRSLHTTLCHYSGLHTTVHKAGFGGSVYSTSYRNNSVNVGHGRNFFDSPDMFKKFIFKSTGATKRILTFLKDAEEKDHDVGVFAPARIINTLSIVKDNLKLSNIRFFDDNEMLQNTYFPGFDIAVESRQSLVAEPPKKLLVMSHSFGENIAQELRDANLHSEIVIWSDIFLAE